MRGLPEAGGRLIPSGDACERIPSATTFPEDSMKTQQLLAAALVFVVLSAGLAGCRGEQVERADAATVPAETEDQTKIANAMSAAPEAISRDATILDWPEAPGGEMRQLRAGTNGWVCLPDRPDTDGNDPMCMDEPWMTFMHAVMTRTEPRIDRLGISYMIAEGGVYASNTDPFATGPAPDNEWGFDGPHLMIVVPEAAALEGLPTKRETGGPYVMYAGTPYAHIMIPVQ
jgi:hypothetical protein